MTEQERLRQIVRDRYKGPEQDLQSSVATAQRFDPDEEARFRSIAEKTGVPLSVVRMAPNELESQIKPTGPDVQRLIRESPKTAEWLKDPNNALIAHDEAESLGLAERAFNAVFDPIRALGGDPLRVAASGLQGLAEAARIGGRAAERLTGTEGLGGALDSAFGNVDDVVLRALFPQQVIGESLEPVAKAIAPPDERRNYTTDVVGGIGTLGMQIALPGAGTVLTAAAEVDELSDRAKKAGTYGTARADAGVALGGGIGYALERFGLAAVVDRLPPKIRNRVLRKASDVVLGGLGEAVTEGTQSVATDLVTQQFIDEEFDAFKNFKYEAGVGFGVGAAVRGALLYLAPGRLRYSQQTQEAAAAIESATRLEKLGELVEGMKLKGRDANALRSALSSFKDQGFENVSVPVEAFRSYAQSQGLAVEALAAELTGGTGSLVEASLTGGDVRVPVERLVASNHVKGLAADVRFAPEGMTANEANKWADSDAGVELAQLFEEVRETRRRVAPRSLDDVLNRAVRADDRRVKAEEGWIYHATNIENARAIAESGSLQTFAPDYGTEQDAWPDGSTDARSYWSKNAGIVKDFAPAEGQSVVLRTRAADSFGTESGTDDVFATEPVQTNLIEVLTEDGWVPLSAEKSTGPILDSSRKIYDDMRSKLAAAGVPDAVADGAAQVAQARYIARSRQLGGIDPWELYREKSTEISQRSFEQFDPSVIRMKQGDPAALLMDSLRQRFDDALVEGYNALIEPMDAFSYPRVPGTNPVKIIKKHFETIGMDPDEVDVEVEEIGRSGLDHVITVNYAANTTAQLNGKTVTRPMEVQATITVYSNGRIMLDISEGQIGGEGNAIYAAVFNYAFNTDRKFVDDQAGLSASSVFRRPELMLSSALKYKTTRHMGTSPGRDLEAPTTQQHAHALPLKFVGNDKKDFRALVEVAVNNVFNTVPGLDAFRWDFKTGVPVNARTGEELSDAILDRMVEDGRLGEKFGNRVVFGRSSLKRAIIGKTLIEEESLLGPEAFRSAVMARVQRDQRLSRHRGMPLYFQGTKPVGPKVKPKDHNAYERKAPPSESYAPTLRTTSESIGPGPRVEVHEQDGELEVTVYAKTTGDFDPILSADYPGDERPVAFVRLKRGEVDFTEVSSSGDAAALEEVRKKFTALDDPRVFRQVEATRPERGAVQFDRDGNRYITLFTGRHDPSTVIHELSHVWLEEMVEDYTRPGVSDQVRKDWDTIRSWLNGLGSQATELEVDKVGHEYFARGIERYFREGNAPSLKLARVFRRFKVWTRSVYASVSELDAPINDDVRAVFDRMFAVPEEIKKAKEKSGTRQTFATAEDMGVSPELFKAYRKAAEEAAAEEEDRLTAIAVDDALRKERGEMKVAKQTIRDEIIAEFQQRPEYRALGWIRSGQTPDGQPVEGVVHQRLDRKKVKQILGADEVTFQNLRRLGLLANKDGSDPEDVAPLFGYDGADAMFRALAAAPRMRDAVSTETDRRFKEKYGDFYTNLAERTESALASVHSDATGQILRAELAALRALHRASGPVRGAVRAQERARAADIAGAARDATAALRDALSEERRERAYERRWLGAEAATQRAEEAKDAKAAMDVPPLSAFREMAAGLVGQTTGRDLKPEAYLKAQRKASKEAYEAALKKDYQAAAYAKQKEILNHYVYLKAVEAKKTERTLRDFAKSLSRKSAQEKLGKAGNGYLEQVNAILAQYKFTSGPLSQKALNERTASLAAFIAQRAADGDELDVGRLVVNESRVIDHRDVSTDQQRELLAALRNLNHMAVETNKVIRGRRKIAFDALKEELVASISEFRPSEPPPIDPKTLGRMGSASKLLKRFDAALIRAEQLLRWFDGEDPNGVWSQSVFKPIADAQNLEMDLTREYTAKLNGLFEEYFESRGRGFLMTQHTIDAIGQPLTYDAMVAVAMNVGNEDNLTKLKKGRGWSDEQLQSVLDRLTKQDWDFVQSVWDMMNEFRPRIAALHKRMTGLEPKWVEALPVETKFGTYRGGYYPLVYSPDYSREGRLTEQEQANALFERNYVRAGTSHGFTEERTKFVAPILLDLGVIPSHFANVIHDVTHREAVMNAWKILNDKDIAQEIINRVGRPYLDSLNVWLQRVANSRVVDNASDAMWSSVFRRLRLNTSIVAMGFKATTMFAQLSGYSNSLEQVSATGMAKATAEFAANPFQMVKYVYSLSGEMRNRHTTMERDMRDMYLKTLGKRGILDFIQRHAFDGIFAMDQAVSIPTWVAAFRDAQEKGRNEEEAIEFADSTVRLTQGAGAMKDLPTVQSGGELMRLMTMFGSFFNLTYNRLRSLNKTQGVGLEKFMRIAGRSMLIWVIPAVLGELLAGRGPSEEDEEEWAEWLLRKIALYPASTVPLVRDVASTLETGFEPSTPTADLATNLVRTIQRGYDVAAGERDPEELAKPLTNTLGYIFGLPSGQLNITGGYLWDIYTGEEIPESMAETTKNLLYRREE